MSDRNFYFSKSPLDITTGAPISFTGDAIDYLSCKQIDINLDDWKWHEELINGVKYVIVTDKIMDRVQNKE